MFSSFILFLFLFHSTSFLHEIYAVSYMWIAAIGFLITLLVGVIVSRLTGGNEILDHDLFATWVHLPPPSAALEEDICSDKVRGRVNSLV